MSHTHPRYIVIEDGATGALGIRDTRLGRDVDTQPLQNLMTDGTLPAYDRELHELGAGFLNQEHGSLENLGVCCCHACCPAGVVDGVDPVDGVDQTKGDAE